MDTAPDSRQGQVQSLQNFQRSDLKQLYSQLADLDVQITDVESRVAHETNLLSAARGLVAMRGGPVDTTAADMRRTSARARPKQRLWTNKDGQIVHHGQHDSSRLPEYTMSACAVAYTDFQKRFEAPRQSFTGCAGRAVILFTEDENDQVSCLLHRVEKGSRLWIVYWLDRNSGQWRHFVRPPRAKGGWRVGLFATRSPNRPSPVGLSLSVVEEIDVDSRTMVVSGVDILDETPVIGLKLYDSNSEAFVDVKSGWLDDEKRLHPLYYDPLSDTSLADFEIEFEEKAKARLDFIDDGSVINIHAMVREYLKRLEIDFIVDNANSNGNGAQDEEVFNSFAVGAFRVSYSVDVEKRVISVRDVTSGMRAKVCQVEAETDPEAKLHLDFQKQFCEDA